jgi:hypothetical protein
MLRCRDTSTAPKNLKILRAAPTRSRAALGGGSILGSIGFNSSDIAEFHLR